MSVLEIKNLTYSYKNHKVFDKLNLAINKYDHITILGKIGSGKTTLTKLIKKGHKSIKCTNNYTIIQSMPSKQIVGKTVHEQLCFYMQLKNYSTRKINIRLKKIVDYFKLAQLLGVDPFCLSIGFQQLIVILSHLIVDYDLYLFDNAFNVLDRKNKETLFAYFKTLKKKTIVCLSSNTEDVFYGENVAIIDQKIVFKGHMKTAFDNDKIYIQNNLKMPFLADLSLKLQYYGIIDKIILDMDELVNAIWK